MTWCLSDWAVIWCDCREDVGAAALSQTNCFPVSEAASSTLQTGSTCKMEWGNWPCPKCSSSSFSLSEVPWWEITSCAEFGFEMSQNTRCAGRAWIKRLLWISLFFCPFDESTHVYSLIPLTGNMWLHYAFSNSGAGPPGGVQVTLGNMLFLTCQLLTHVV